MNLLKDISIKMVLTDIDFLLWTYIFSSKSLYIKCKYFYQCKDAVNEYFCYLIGYNVLCFQKVIELFCLKIKHCI